ncbi:helix-turn-helix domain-containing protein [Sediminispirochaeta bajacaliforniensis]|uniref:helix-turn-helix domain-containing protein n=1 Tax=Sediminispirochaeta bajacaliforniensis TaxID=148 RepID=UPI001FE1FAA2|nr:helix-turn-helix domain-containing protein [Sediminispirochaeta bajacaliforniensis]
MPISIQEFIRRCIIKKPSDNTIEKSNNGQNTIRIISYIPQTKGIYMHYIAKTILAIEYIEDHLTERLDLKSIASAIHVSPYHLHRTFTLTTGMTIHDYLRRRRLSEAAKMLCTSDKSILEISLLSGYESQQAFSRIFTSLYKYPPNTFREKKLFYPLQLRFDFKADFDMLSKKNVNTHLDIRFAQEADIPAWMDLVRLVIDGYPFLNEDEYIQVVKKNIGRKQALIVNDGNIVVGNMLLSYQSGSIDFFGVHPLYRRRTDLTETLLDKAIDILRNEKKEISITTYREGDKADTGYRKTFQKLGFIESEFLIEFGYPSQKFIFHKNT